MHDFRLVVLIGLARLSKSLAKEDLKEQCILHSQ